MRTVWISRQSRKPAFVDVRVNKLSQLLRQRW